MVFGAAGLRITRHSFLGAVEREAETPLGNLTRLAYMLLCVVSFSSRLRSSSPLR